MSELVTWDEPEEIAEMLYAAYPDTDPLSLSFPKLHQMIIDLDDFAGDPDAVTERVLETIQMAWLEYYTD